MLHARILTYLDTAVRAGSIRKAAARLGIAASSISRQIAELERELGSPLFEHLPGHLRLTAAGEILMAHVRQTLKEHDRALARIEDLKSPGSGQVRIATMNGPVGGFVPHAVMEFAGRFPQVRFTVQSMVAAELVATLKAGEADVGIGYNLPDDPRLTVVDSLEVRLGAVVDPHHPLARRAGVRLADCAVHPIVLADGSSAVRRLIHFAAARSRSELTPVIDTNSIELIKRSLIDGETVTFLSPADVVEETAAGRLVYLPLTDASVDSQTLSIVQREGAVLNFAVTLFIEQARRRLADLMP
ncbi:LysR family transcriptional regulator [Zavarzinia compransoris]|uniref:LysR family transcriptional regulator n=1 Tax=Zavarzinia marina TaxID=2911065 RepID=UPI001F34EDF8|nr:LysR family transcriptional regulator [Zavarzinia marina]MCF4165321.1 LysR family transcriptional regulator [Zavarzinia marina]